MTSFKSIEAALIRTYNVHPDDVGAFRARLTFLQKQGLLGPDHRPGRGKAIAYGPDQFWRMIFACETAQLGMSPSVTLWFIETLWPKLSDCFKAADRVVAKHDRPSPNDVLMQFTGLSLMTSAWRTTEANVRWAHLREANKWMRDPPPSRDVTVNLTARLREFRDALAAIEQEADPSAPEISASKRNRRRKGVARATHSRSKAARRTTAQADLAMALKQAAKAGEPRAKR
jgi:hypothetical protein